MRSFLVAPRRKAKNWRLNGNKGPSVDREPHRLLLKFRIMSGRPCDIRRSRTSRMYRSNIYRAQTFKSIDSIRRSELNLFKPVSEANTMQIRLTCL